MDDDAGFFGGSGKYLIEGGQLHPLTGDDGQM